MGAAVAEPDVARKLAGAGLDGDRGGVWHHGYRRGRLFHESSWARRGFRGAHTPLALGQGAEFVGPGQYFSRPFRSQYGGQVMSPQPEAFLQIGASPPEQHSSAWKAEKSAATRDAISRMFSPNNRGGGQTPKKGGRSRTKKNGILAPEFSNPRSTSSSKDEMRFASSQQKQKVGAASDPWWVNPPPWWLPSPPEWGAPPPSVYSPFYSPGTIPNQFQAQAMPAYNPQPAPNQYVPQQYRL